MTRLRSRMWRMSAAILAVFALGIFAVAAQVSPPNAGSSPDTPQEISLPTSVLDRYVGSYNLGGSAVFKVTRKGQQLPTLQSGLVNLGALQTVQFRAVGAQGWDVYDVRYEKGMVTFRIGLSADGKIAGALLQAGP